MILAPQSCERIWRKNVDSKECASSDEELANPGGIQRELNWLPTVDTQDDEYLSAIRVMRSESPASVEQHYIATEAALTRMRLAHIRGPRAQTARAD